MKNDIAIDYVRDNHFTELRDAEIQRERMQTLDQMQNYVGEYYSREYIQKNVLRMSDEDIEKMKEQIENETQDSAGDDNE